MVKTLQITSVLVVLLTGVVLAFPGFLHARTADPEPILSSPGVIEQFRKAKGQTEKERSSRSSVSPLVKQAEAFALYLNPPAQPEVPPSQAFTAQSATSIRPQTVSAKFSLIGTSYHPTNSELSVALIDEPGKGLRWIRPSSQIGHLVVEQIKDGAVVIRDGDGTYELTVPERPGRVTFLEGQKGEPVTATLGTGPDTTGSAYINPVSTQAQQRPTFTKGRTTSVASPSPQPEMSEQEQKALSELVQKLKELQKGLSSDRSDRSAAPQDQNALMDKLISNFRASRVSAEEADKLSGLGERLKTGEQEPNKNSPRKTTTRPRIQPLPARQIK